jgi:hypothetical protein
MSNPRTQESFCAALILSVAAAISVAGLLLGIGDRTATEQIRLNGLGAVS